MEILIFASTFFFFFSTLSVSASDRFSEALLSLKSEITDDFDSLSDWSLSPETKSPVACCSWSGVTCDKNLTTVTSLDLSAKSLRGSILSGDQFKVFSDLITLNLSHNSFSGELPTGIFSLAGLESLDISRNNFSGHFPPGISSLRRLVVLDAFSNSFSGNLPLEVSELVELRVLNFAGSYFSGSIPAEYGLFRRIEFVHLAGNFLGGEIPVEIGKLKTLIHMEIGYNSYRGEIPWQMGNMSALRYLDIAGANLSGSIPGEFGNLTKLESLFLFRNRLSGSVPAELGAISSLQSLDLSDNLITGTIPESFSGLRSLRLLSLMYNAMSGTVPDWIADLPSLETLMIWNNFFGGSLPRRLGRGSKLKWVDASTNELSGTIPEEICANGVLEKLILFSNRLSGGLSKALSNCSSLVRVRLENNSFSGEIPLRFEALKVIAYVDLSINNFTGGVPKDFSKAIRLEYFNVSDNPSLGGSIPSGTWKSPVLQNFSASSCGISSELPPFEGCDSVAVIELSSNGLTGDLPESISRCRSLERLDLSNNDLSGEIPEELAGLSRLENIDLSHNAFVGKIPSKLGGSSSLKLLNVSFNDISGSVPGGKAFRGMDGRAFLGNPKLCGPPTTRPCSSNSSPVLWIVVLSIGVVTLTALLITAAMIFLRRSRSGKWRMVSYPGLPQFTAKDVLRSFGSEEESKAVLPTGITVSVKKIEWEAKAKGSSTEFIDRIGISRQKNLSRLLGLCYNNRTAYLLYDYLPNGTLAEKLSSKMEWQTKHRIAISVARGLWFLHHGCSPAIPHGELRSKNVAFDENMEPRLTEFGIKLLLNSKRRETGEFSSGLKEEPEDLYTDIYSFGEILLEILSNGGLTNAQSKRPEVLLTEILAENKVSPIGSTTRDEIKLVLEVALMCTKTRPVDRPSMEDVLKLLTGSQSQRKT